MDGFTGRINGNDQNVQRQSYSKVLTEIFPDFQESRSTAQKDVDKFRMLQILSLFRQRSVRV